MRLLEGHGLDVRAYVETIRVLGECRRSYEPDPYDASVPSVAWSSLKTDPRLATWLTRVAADDVLRSVLEHEAPTWSIVSPSVDGSWEVRLYRRLTGFDRATSIDTYLELLPVLLGVEQPSPAAATPSPFSLPAALDYFDVVWQLRFTEKPLIQLPGAERTAFLATPAGSSEELASRLGALSEILRALQVPSTPGVDGHGVKRLRAWLESRIAPDDIEPVARALDRLGAVAQLRNGMTHSAPSVPFPEACAALGVGWPILDPGRAWTEVQARCIEALETMRIAIQQRAED
jgi:hypothetical protein